MVDTSFTLQPEFHEAHRAHVREQRIHTGKVASALVVFLMPPGVVLDYFVYPGELVPFLWIRLFGSALAAVLWILHASSFGQKHVQWLGLPIPLVPAFCVAWMIYRTGDTASPYYAGLNLILLAVSVVGHWSFIESLLVVACITLMYFVAAAAQSGSLTNWPGLVNNLYFLILTGVIVVTGNSFYNRLRFREFCLTYELDMNRRALAAQNQVLEDTLKQLKETESQLVQTEKIVSLGRLSAGIIHEINNPLNFATTGLYVLRNQGEHLAKEKPEEFSEVLRDIEEGVSRVKNIVSDLRSFTHPDTEQRDRLKIADVITASLRFLSNEWKDKVQIDQAVPSDLICHANKNKLTQVFVNLLQNSLDALKQKPVGPEPPIIRISGRQQGGKIFVSVRDNGEGIDPDNLPRIFDPFFTTRDVGKGMGMGLSISYRIVQELRGQITVMSERGKYCEFTVELPVPASESIAA
jgi:two-component system, sensor histidine kinase PhcS